VTMAERALRGTRLGATSYENDRNTDLAPRQEVDYTCTKGHRFTVTLAAEAEVPMTWECRNCGATALRVNGELPQTKKGKPPRTHWDMLMERRTIEDLEEVLAERLEILRAARKKSARSRRPHDARPQEHGSPRQGRPSDSADRVRRSIR